MIAARMLDKKCSTFDQPDFSLSYAKVDKSYTMDWEGGTKGTFVPAIEGPW